MPTKKQTISVRVDDGTKRRIERAARLSMQSSGAFLEKAGEVQAREVLLGWALERHRLGEASFSELASETGLAVEEIMLAASERGAASDALDAFLSSARSLAEASSDPGFLARSEEAVRVVKRERSLEASVEQ